MKKFQSWYTFAMLAVLLFVPVATGDEPAPENLPRFAPLDPVAAVNSFDVLPGFQLELVAAEPMVRSPVAMDFDENGRLYVVEMCGYSERGHESLGAIRLLQDSDGDGKFDSSTLFAEGLSWPTAVICYDGGVFVGAAPHIYYFKDRDDDGSVDEQKLVFTGFNRHNVQGLLNSFRWGLDNRIHGATGTNGGIVKRPDQPDGEAVNLSGRDFSFDPRRLDLRPESGGAQHGMCFDDWGRKFICSNSDHLQMVVYEDRYAARNPLAQLPPARRSIAADGGQAEVFRLSPVEPWRVWRTRLRVAGQASGVVEAGGRAAGYFSGATGVTIYRGNAFPAEHRGQAFIGDVGSNLIHRKRLAPDGVALIGHRIDQRREFVASRDTWFRPAQFANAPDGTLYIADIYREVIEHPQSIPEQIKQHLDLDNGSSRGRIYRIVPDDFRQPEPPVLEHATTTQLVATLNHRNGWHRDVAARLLYERRDDRATAALRQLLRSATLAEGRLHALYALHGLERLGVDDILHGMANPHPRVREHAVRLAESLAATSPAIRKELYSLTKDPDLRVRYQLAWTLGAVREAAAWQALTVLAESSAGVPLLQAAVATSLAGGGGEALPRLVADYAWMHSITSTSLLSDVFEQLGAQASADQLSQFDAHLAALTGLEASKKQAIARAVVRGARRRNGKDNTQLAETLPRTIATLDELLATFQENALDEDLSNEQRQSAIRGLGLGQFTELRTTFADLLAGHNPQDIQLATLKVIGEFSDPGVADILLEAWPGMTPRIRNAAGHVLLSRSDWSLAFLAAVEGGAVAVSELDPTLIMQLASRTEPEIHERVEQLLGDRRVGRRDELVEDYRVSLKMHGHPDRGRVVFRNTCSSCHRLEGVGHEIGPSLAAITNRGADAILLNVLDPNREVNPQYINYTVLTTDGRLFSGLIAGETASSITLRRSEDEVDSVLRSDIEEMRSTGQSMMPEGLEKQIDKRAMADLIAYLRTMEESSAGP